MMNDEDLIARGVEVAPGEPITLQNFLNSPSGERLVDEMAAELSRRLNKTLDDIEKSGRHG